MRYIMCTRRGAHMGHPLGCPIRAGSPKGGRATKRKGVATYNGHPLGCPYACPTGACINGVGSLPTPYGPTLRGAHCRSPKGSSKKKKVRWGHPCEPTEQITKQINRENMCAGNLGQILCEIGLNLRLDVCLPPPQPLLQR